MSSTEEGRWGCFKGYISSLFQLCEEDSRHSRLPSITLWLLPFLWAYAEEKCTERKLEEDVGLNQHAYDQLLDIIEDLTEDVQEGELEGLPGLAAEVWDSGEDRANKLEQKAQSYMVGIVLTVGVASVFATLASGSQSLQTTVRILLGLSVGSLLLAVFSAVKVRAARSQQMPTVRDVERSLEEARMGEEDQALLRLARAKWNEYPAHQRAMWLLAAERHFLVGVGFLALGIVGTLFPSLIEGSVRTLTGLLPTSIGLF